MRDEVSLDAVKTIFLGHEDKPEYEKLLTAEEIAGELGIDLPEDKYRRRDIIDKIGQVARAVGHYARGSDLNWVAFVRPEENKNGVGRTIRYGITRKKQPTVNCIARATKRVIHAEANLRLTKGATRASGLLPSAAEIAKELAATN